MCLILFWVLQSRCESSEMKCFILPYNTLLPQVKSSLHHHMLYLYGEKKKKEKQSSLWCS